MIAEIKHYWNERINAILLFSVMLTLPIIPIFLLLPLILILVLMSIDLTILITILIYTLSIYIILLAIELIIIYILDIFFSITGKCCINEIVSMCKNREKHSDEYSAVLIGNNLSGYKNIFTNGGACGLYFLNLYFENTNQHCQIRQDVDKSDLDEFVLDPNCQELYILGHGSKKSFRMKNDKDNVDYSKYKGKIKHKKRVVAQLHCVKSKIGDESLVDILASDINNSYVGCGYIFRTHIWWYCFNMWIKSISSPPISNLKRHLFYIIKCIQK